MDDKTPDDWFALKCRHCGRAFTEMLRKLEHDCGDNQTKHRLPKKPPRSARRRQNDDGGTAA